MKFAQRIAFSFVLTCLALSAHAGMVKKLIVGGAVAGAVATAHHADGFEPLDGKPIPNHPAYLAEQKRRHREVMADSPSYADIRATPEYLRSGQCVAAATYALIGKAYGSYPAYVNQLVEQGYFRISGEENKGIPLDSLRYLLTQAGFPHDYYPVESNNRALASRIADAVDAGKAVFLRIDAAKAYELQTHQAVQPSSLKEYAAIYLGSEHLIRVTAVDRDAQGHPMDFGIFDINTRDYGYSLSGKEFLQLLDAATLGTAFRRGALITHNAVYPPVVR
jgi:hypothetical protein